MNRTNIDENVMAQGENAAGRSERTRRDDARERRRAEMARLREVGRNLGAQIEEQVHKRPFVILGAAVGAGFIAGSLFGSRLGQIMLAAGIGYAAKNVIGGDLDVEGLEAGLERLRGDSDRE